MRPSPQETAETLFFVQCYFFVDDKAFLLKEHQKEWLDA